MRPWIRVSAFIVFGLIIINAATNNYANNMIFEEIAVSNVVELQDWTSHNLQYIVEVLGVLGLQEWKLPKDTFMDGGGDCEDLATFHSQMLKRLGYKPVIVMIWWMVGGKEEGHAITMFMENGKVSLFSNLEYVRTDFKTYYGALYDNYSNIRKIMICKNTRGTFCETF